MKNIEKSEVKKILVISLSNLGDVILTFPVIDALKQDFSQARLFVVVGPKAADLFTDNPYLSGVYVFDKHQPIAKTISWILNLRKEQFDLVVDLRNTAIPLFLLARFKTPLWMAKTDTLHMKQKHLNRLKEVYPYSVQLENHYALHFSQGDERSVEGILRTNVGWNQRFVVVSPGAADSKKRWTQEGFARLSDLLMKTYHQKVIFVGDKGDREVAVGIMQKMQERAVNLCGETTLKELAVLLLKAQFVISNDSAVMHLSSYLNRPTLGIFGPTDVRKYGPWSKKSFVISKNIACPACQKNPKQKEHICMSSISFKDVWEAIKIHFEGLRFSK